MTDARLPDKWLTDLSYLELSDQAWRLFTSALMWCNQQGTDGRVPNSALQILRPAEVLVMATDELVEKGHWTESDSGYEFAKNWDQELGQSTKAEVQSRRDSNRERQRRLRERNEGSGEVDSIRDHSKSYPKEVVTRHVTRDLGQARTGKDRNKVGVGITAPCKHCASPTGAWNVGGTAVSVCGDCIGIHEPL